METAAPPTTGVVITDPADNHTTAQSIEKLTAGLLDIAKTKSVSAGALLQGLERGAQPLPLNTLDAFGTGTLVNTAV